jgi:hypothetical protein
MLSTVSMPAPDGTDQGGLLRQAIDSALRGAGDAIVQLQAGNYITNPSPRDWVFNTQADFDRTWQISGGTATVDTATKRLVIAPTPGGTSVTIQSRDAAALGIASTGSPNLLATIAVVPASTTFDLQTRSMGTTSYVSRKTGTLAVGAFNQSFGFTSGTALIVNNLKLVFTKAAGFVAGDAIQISQMKIRLDDTWAYAGIGINDAKEQHVIGLDMSFITNKSLTLQGPSDASRATLATQVPYSDFFNVGDFNNLTIRNVNFDYVTRPWVQTNITAVNTATNTVTVTLDSAADLALLRDANWAGLLANGADPSSSGVGYIARVCRGDLPGAMALGIAQNNTFYPNQSDSFAGSYAYSPTRTYTAKLQSTAGIAAGMKMVWATRNGAYATVRFSGNNLTMQNVNVYKSGGTMVSSFGAGATGIGGAFGGKFVFDNVQLAPVSSADWITQPADGIHINSPYYVSTGPSDPSISINNCRIQSNNDDSIAIYQSGGQVTAVTGNKLTVSWAFMPKVGDTVVVYGHPGVERGRSTVTAISGSQITLATPIAAATNADPNLADFVFNYTRNAWNSYLGNTVFQDARGNGLKTRLGSWTVERNTFTRLGWSAVSLGSEINGNNTSGFYPSDVVIRDNVMTDVNFSDSSNQLANGVIEAGMFTPSGAKPSQQRLVRNISILNNTITGIDRAGINLTSVENVRIEGNTLIGRATDPFPDDHTAPIVFNNVRYATLANNTITDARSATDAAISVDPLYALNWFTTKNFDGTPTMKPSDTPRIGPGMVYNLLPGTPEMVVGRFEDDFTGGSKGDYFGITAQPPASFSVPTSGSDANQLVFSGTTLEGIYRRYGVYGDLTLSASVRIVSNYASDGSGLIFRATNSGAHPNYKLTDFYWLAINPTNGTLALMRRDGAVDAGGNLTYTETVLKSVPIAGGVTLGTTYQLQARAIGTQIFGWVTNSAGVTTSLMHNDTSPDAILWGGIGVRVNGTSTAVAGTKTVFDNLAVQANVAPRTVDLPTVALAPGLTGRLSATGFDDDVESALTYTWSKVSGPGSVSFDVNGTNAAKSALASYSAAGTYVLAVTVTDANGESTTWNTAPFTPDAVAPTVTGTAFRYDESPERLAVVFSEDVGASLSTSSFTVRTQAGDVVPYTLQFDATTFTASLRFDGGLPNGNYRLTINANGVADLAGNPLSGANPTFDFFALAGDVNRDRSVDFDDLLILAANYNQQGRTYGQGNIDRSADGLVSFDDLLFLAANYNQAVPPPIAAPPLSLRRSHHDGDLWGILS